MEKRPNVIKVSQERWNELKKLHGFRAEEVMPEILQNRIKDFLTELTSVQLSSELLENKQKDLPIAIEMFTVYLIKIKNLLRFLEQKYRNSVECRILQKLSKLFEELISTLRHSNPQEIKQIISNFNDNFSKTIENF